MYDDFFDFVYQKKGVCAAFVIIVIVSLSVSWLMLDDWRNSEMHYSTDGAVERIESGVERTADKIDSAKRAVEKAEETIGSASERIERSAGAAEKIAGGIAEVERGLDDCIQRGGRIKNILSDIEAEHRQRTQGTSKAGLAK